MQGGIYGKQIDNLALIIFIPLRITEEKPFSNLSILPIIPRLTASTLVDSLRMPSVDKQREILFQNIIQNSMNCCVWQLHIIIPKQNPK